ncbi:MAG: TonB-dependent receptor [Gemmatimonadetes bacterium]|nr:TonB-dependent receptor [Gemmatimonadota bacterium]
MATPDVVCSRGRSASARQELQRVHHSGRRLARLVLASLLVLAGPGPAHAQTAGSVLGRVSDAQSGAPLAGVTVQVLGFGIHTVTAADGRFLLAGVPAGERTLRFEVLGYKPREVERVLVQTGRSTPLIVVLATAPIALPGVSVAAERVQLVETTVSTTRDVMPARELQDLPIDRIGQAVELTPGVSGGHFRGGRLGQEVHVVDGLEVKNQLESATQGMGLELAPTSLQEIEVITGGFGAQYGSALSGVVNYVTRRGDRDRWDGRAAVLTDQWAPGSLFYGFTSLSVSGGGPVRFLGNGATLFADVLAQGMLDADPHARGLACTRPEDGEDALRARIENLRNTAPQLYCPYPSQLLPHQRGDKLILFGRFDRPLTAGLSLTVSFLRNRLQRELYTPEWRFAAAQLGQREIGTLGTAALDWTRQGTQQAWHVTLRGALMRLDRHLGAVDPWTFSGRGTLAGFGPGNFRFLGEDFVHRPLAEQLAAGSGVPGYVEPSGVASPFGVAGEGIFFTAGTPHIANWSRTDLASVDLVGELLARTGSSLRAGSSVKLHGVESYERTLSHLAGSSPTYARFYPRTASAFAEAHIGVSDEINFDVGLRLDAFRSGLSFRTDRRDFLSPVLDAAWNVSVNPRFGVSMPVPGSRNTAALRFNYGYVSQPPDFRYFLDSTVGDSLRTDIRRQGNPNLSFERGKSYEVSLSKLFAERVGVALTLFRKELANVITGALRIGETGDQLFSTDDEGTVRGAELAVRGRWRDVGLRASYALQKATGVTPGLESDSLVHVDGSWTEYPLAFDRRHSIDAALLYGRSAGAAASAWTMALTATVESGYPHDILAAAGDTLIRGSAWLPWTSSVNLRLVRDLGRLPLCRGGVWSITADGRNLLGRENVLAYRGDTHGLAPSLAAVDKLAGTRSLGTTPIPHESPRYAAATDLDGNGLITPWEYQTARFAAALERNDPTLFFGEPRQLRLGVEVSF